MKILSSQVKILSLEEKNLSSQVIFLSVELKILSSQLKIISLEEKILSDEVIFFRLQLKMAPMRAKWVAGQHNCIPMLGVGVVSH